MNYVLPNLMGRLGNNMFMIAHAYARSKELNIPLIIARNQVRYEGNDYSQNIFRKLNFIDRFVDKEEYIRYTGYFQSESYFEDYKEEVKELFRPPIEFVDRIRKELPVVFDSTLVHIRRGDYLHLPNFHPSISAEYISKAISLIASNHYLIASDDIKWCKNNIKLQPSIYLEGYNSHEQLWIMSMCNNFIIANSSYSWWAAYLSSKAHKVIAPEIWFGPQRGGDWSEIYCKEWYILPSYIKSGYIYPKK